MLKSKKNSARTVLLSGVALVPLFAGVAVIGSVWPGAPLMVWAACNPCNPCAAKPAACNPCNPCAAKPAACNPCNPCAAKPAACNPCNPCAAKPAACNPCNPCAAKPAACNPCNPCAAKPAACNPCNPCAAKPAACNPCNPCAAKPAACNPCNPCNPCAAKGADTGCYVPRLQQAAVNPCAAKPAACTPVNPCAATSSACNPCNPCNPCAAVDAVELTAQEAIAAYECVYPHMKTTYAQSGIPGAEDWADWAVRFSTQPYPSATHGGRYVHNYASSISADSYSKYEDVEKMPETSLLIKDSFTVGTNGHVAVGPLFMMEKMAAGFNAETGDWRYYMLTPDGKLFGMTNGDNHAAMAYCGECHGAAEDSDYLFFLPEELRRAD